MMISFAGVSSDSVNVVCERFPARPIPHRRYTAEVAPGRSGALLFDEGAFDNVAQSYEIYLSAMGALTSFQEHARNLARWLLSPTGYQRLYDGYDPDTFRLAYYDGPVDIENSWNELGRCTITFNCKPWRYLWTGDSSTTYTGAATLTNPTAFDAEPLIVIHGSGAGTMQIGSYTIAISDIDDGMTIDSEAMDCYNGANNRNNLITLTPTYKYPLLHPGANTITISGGITSFDITPRWRCL